MARDESVQDQAAGEMNAPLRTDLAGRLMTVQNNYVLGMAALSMFAAPAALATLTGSQAAFGGSRCRSIRFEY